MDLQKRTYFRCTECGDVESKWSIGLNEPTPDDICGHKSLKVFRIKYSPMDDEQNDKRSLNYIPPMHAYIEFGMKGGPKEITSKRQLESYAKEHGKILASDKEISQEADHHRKNNERESDRKSRARVTEIFERMNYERSNRR
jgi:hypothetical protein